MKKGQREFKSGEIIIYKTSKGPEIQVKLEKDMVWLTQKQMATLFDKGTPTINEHVKNIFKEGELRENSVIRKFRITATDGKTYETNFYNLDVIISVGYRVKSLSGTQFRIWATKTLRAHIVDGYTINKKRITQNYEAFLKAVEDVKKLLPTGGVVDAESALELVKLFANTWVSLDAYDKSTFPKSGAIRKRVRLTSSDLSEALQKLKQELIAKNEATELFGAERQRDSVAGIVGNVLQSFGGNDIYPTIEEKAAHFLYFMVKNHPFVDGNKRSGAFTFVWFLKKAGALDTSRMTPEALTALTLLVAESNPKDKDRLIGLVLILLRKS